MRIRFFILFFFAFSMASAQLNINNYIQVGQTRLQIGNYVGAIENFNIVIKFKPQLPEPYFLRGLAKHQLEDFRGAIEDYNRAIEIKPYYPDAYSNRGLAKLELEDYKGAIADYDKALELSPQNAGIYNNRGIAKISMKDIDGAIADYDKALSITPSFVNAYINRSNAYILKGNIREAIRDLNRAIIIRPHFSNAYLLRGLARYQMDDYASALRDFDQTLRFDPQNAFAYNNRGIVKQGLEDYEGAIMDYDMALQLNPTLPNAYFNRGIAKELLKRPGSDEDFKMARRLDPKLDIERYRIDEEQRASQAYAQQQQKKQQQQQQPGQVLAFNAAGQANNQQQAQSPDPSGKQNQQAGQAQKPAGQQAGSSPQSKEQQERRKFRLALADTRNLPNTDEEEEAEDGRVQNKNVIIELQRIFVLTSFSEQAVDYERLQYYNMSLEGLNRFNNYTPLMTITNRKTDDFTEHYQNQILFFNEKLKNNQDPMNLLSRGIFRFLTGQYSEALNDLNRSISKNPENMLAWFTRANNRIKMVEIIESVPDNTENLVIPLNGSSQAPAQPEKKEMLSDYQYIMDDFQKAIDLDPKFPFSWFNRAVVLSKLGRHEEALANLTRAIELQPDFAEAYFNRGLIKIYQDDTEGGAIDLSKAGELGIQEAYNVIKRYCN